MKIGLDQINKPEPNWMKKAFNILVIVVLPAFAVYVLAVPDNYLSQDLKIFLGATSTFVVAIFQGIKELSGKNG